MKKKIAFLCSMVMVVGIAMHAQTAYAISYDDAGLQSLRQAIVLGNSDSEYDITGDGVVDVRDIVRLKKEVVSDHLTDIGSGGNENGGTYEDLFGSN